MQHFPYIAEDTHSALLLSGLAAKDAFAVNFSSRKYSPSLSSRLSRN